MKDFDLSVLMPVYNTELKLLDQAICSILDQTFSDFYFYIIDDGSKEPVKEYLRSIKDPRVKIIYNEKNLGLTKSLNKALALISTKWVARMDSDDIALPERLEMQMEYLRSHPNVTVLGGRAVFVENNRSVTRKCFPVINSEIRASIIFYNPIIHPTVIMNRQDILSMGGYPESLYSEDYALWLKLVFETDFVIENLDRVVLKYRKGVERPEYQSIQINNSRNLISRVYDSMGTPVPLFLSNVSRYTKESLITDLDIINIMSNKLRKKFSDFSMLYFNEALSREVLTILKSIKLSFFESPYLCIKYRSMYLLSRLFINLF